MPYYCNVKGQEEVYRANTAKLIASVARYHKITLEEAKKKLDESTMETPVVVDDEEAWYEEV